MYLSFSDGYVETAIQNEVDESGEEEELQQESSQVHPYY